MNLKCSEYVIKIVDLLRILQDFSPLSALGLQRVGEERPSPSKEPSIQLNRRGMVAIFLLVLYAINIFLFNKVCFIIHPMSFSFFCVLSLDHLSLYFRYAFRDFIS